MDQWSRRNFVHKRNTVAGQQPIKTVVLESLKCTSSEVINQLIDQIADTIPDEPGLYSLTIREYEDENSLENWPLQHLVQKATRCEHLEIDKLMSIDKSKNPLWLEAASEICQASDYLKRLIIVETRTNADDGAKFLQQLADSELASLEMLDLSD